MIMHDLTELGLLRSIWRSRFGTNGMASSISRPADRTSLGLSWQRVAALNPPPRSLHELKQGLLCVWSSLPIPVSDNLINSMEIDAANAFKFQTFRKEKANHCHPFLNGAIDDGAAMLNGLLQPPTTREDTLHRSVANYSSFNVRILVLSPNLRKKTCKS
ncbi:hypothetical protein TNCV_4559241 [Trichonephila clavipes]|nr:hypothetical protein TNCV_4559241 [Trichonephila clavipes]